MKLASIVNPSSAPLKEVKRDTDKVDEDYLQTKFVKHFQAKVSSNFIKMRSKNDDKGRDHLTTIKK
jgi:hypothetical protein